MKILAVEFSSAQRGVAVLDGERLLGAAMEAATRETPALGLVGRAFGEASLEREAIECLAIGLGPGSYTGIRAAIALAQGWALASGPGGVKLLGVSSVDALAVEAQGRGWFGKVNLVIDAQRNELYLAGYEISAADCREIRPLKLATVQEARTRFAAGELMAGPEADRWFDAGRVLFPTAAALGRLASERKDFVPPEEMVPIYLRETAFVKAPPPRVVPE